MANICPSAALSQQDLLTSEENKIPLTCEVMFRKLNVNYFTDYLILIDSFFNLLFPFLGEKKSKQFDFRNAAVIVSLIN